jgi:uncharacterized protein DUF6275
MDPNNPNPIDPADNQIMARVLVMDYFNKKVEKTDVLTIGLEDTYVVMFTFVLGNWKALVSTTISDGMYYEVTYNREKGETYLDAYKKWENVCIPDGEPLQI